LGSPEIDAADYVYLSGQGPLRTDGFAKVYKEHFSGILSVQTTLQRIPSIERKPDAEGRYPDMEQVSLIAVRRRGRSNPHPAP